MQENQYKILLKELIEDKNKYILRTYGCQMNEHDSEQVEFILNSSGLERVGDIKDANIVIMNTCAIRGTAENKAFGFLGNLKNLKSKNKDLKIVVSGCLPKIDDAFENLVKNNKHVDILMGTSNYNNLPELLYKSFFTKDTIVDISDQYDLDSSQLNYSRMYKHKSFVNITYGCNNFCSYCVVPYTRGREQSREPFEIINEIKELAIDGVKEITLLGQNVNSYGKTLDERISFAKLIELINEIEGIERIRFMTSHPKDISDDLINLYGKLEKLSKHLHLPVQSGSDKVLKDMNRKYTSDDYKKIINKVKSIDKNIALTTDIIVGFPGETEEDFQDTIDLVKYVEYDSIFMFLYSPREGTPAATMERQIHNDVKMDRFNRLTEVVNEIAFNKNKKYLDKEVVVLVDEVSKNNDKILSGRTDTFKLVNFEGNSSLIGNLVNVKINKVGTFSLDGTIT
ncbi:MAG: tRNA (N6-isopentenyl adenosine(37)-C2)-methylthiotransferase MiaB [Tissierellia bacterium]|nr:tRNA (N6-isopentenyl adenosine(37)-C2)-methylthiotransferase MiaB [Tissierellia bacterium]